ncbi:hypothetical protein ATCC90586_002257 [Pythium insidiosum]|nr:hypothetical protein ATCC90586_002257 [Pythium insidiosum]
MTDFIRTIWQNANQAAKQQQLPHDTAPDMARPVNQIQIPPTVAAAATAAAAVAAVAASTTTQCAMAVEKQRLIKVEVPDATAPQAAVMDASKAQRAARRDVVNARRDKRKALGAPTTPCAAENTASSTPSLNAPAVASAVAADAMDTEEVDDKCKKMKTGRASSVAVTGGLAAAALATPAPGMLFTPEIDAAGEERIRAMEAQLETLDPDSKEAKKKRRLIRNRMSAQLHRERKKAYVGQLEDQLMEKDRELQLLQEKLAKMMDESEKLKKQLVEAEHISKAVAAPSAVTDVTKTVPQSPVAAPSTPQQTAAIPSVTASPMVKSLAAPSGSAPVAIKVEKNVDEVVIKEEPQSWDSPWPLDSTDSWALQGLEDTEMVDVDVEETEDLLRDFDYPFAGLDVGYPDFSKPQHELHPAKKNLAMMMAVMFSMSCFGNSPAFQNVIPGSNFSSMFDANPPKEYSQMSVASRIVACLEKTTWKEFRDVSSWVARHARGAAGVVSKEEADVSVKPVASPSAASDVTDSSGSCDSPAQQQIDDCFEIDGFEYPVEDHFAAPVAEVDSDSDWLGGNLTDVDDVDVIGVPEEVAVTTVEEAAVPLPVAEEKAQASGSMTKRLYEKLTALWREKNQVLLTVHNEKQEVTHRTVADLSVIREGLQSGNFFTKVFGGEENTQPMTTVTDDHSVTFLYPMSAFAGDVKHVESFAGPSADPMFLEVSCQVNGGAVAMQM